MTARQAWVRDIPVELNLSSDEHPMGECRTPSSHQNSVGSSTRKTKVPEVAMPDFIRLIHGNTNGRRFLVKEFMTFWSRNKNGEQQISKSSLLQKIREIGTWMACPEEGPMHLRACWYVAEKYRTQYLDAEQLSLPNRWVYALTPKRKSEITGPGDKVDKEEKERKNVPLITQFTKKITQEEMKKQLTEKPATPKVTPTVNKPAKRVALISVPRGEQFSKSPRVSLIDKFLLGDKSSGSPNIKGSDEKKDLALDDDDVMIIDDDSSEKCDSNSKAPENPRFKSLVLPQNGESKIDVKVPVHAKSVADDDKDIEIVDIESKANDESSKGVTAGEVKENNGIEVI